MVFVHAVLIHADRFLFEKKILKQTTFVLNEISCYKVIIQFPIRKYGYSTLKFDANIAGSSREFLSSPNRFQNARKKRSNTNAYKRNKSKLHKTLGHEYISAAGKTVSCAKLGPTDAT